MSVPRSEGRCLDGFSTTDLWTLKTGPDFPDCTDKQ